MMLAAFFIPPKTGKTLTIFKVENDSKSARWLGGWNLKSKISQRLFGQEGNWRF